MHQSPAYRVRFLLIVALIVIGVARPVQAQHAGLLPGLSIEDLLVIRRVLHLSPAQMVALLDQHDAYVGRLAADEPYWLRRYDRQPTMDESIRRYEQRAADYRRRAGEIRAHDATLFEALAATLSDSQLERLPIVRAMLDRRLFIRAQAEISITGANLSPLDRLLILADRPSRSLDLPNVMWAELTEYGRQLNAKLAALDQLAVDDPAKSARRDRDELGITDPNARDRDAALQRAIDDRQPWLADMREIDELSDQTLLRWVTVLDIQDATRLMYDYCSKCHSRGHPTWNQWYVLGPMVGEFGELLDQSHAEQGRELIRAFIDGEGLTQAREVLEHLYEHRQSEALAYAQRPQTPEQRQAEADRNLELVRIEYDLGMKAYNAVNRIWQSIADGDEALLEALTTAARRHARALRQQVRVTSADGVRTSPLVPVLMSISKADLVTFIDKLGLSEDQRAAAETAIDTYRDAVGKHDVRMDAIAPIEARQQLRKGGAQLVLDLRDILGDEEGSGDSLTVLDRLAETIDRTSWRDRYMFLSGLARSDAGWFVLLHRDIELTELATIDEQLQQWHALMLPLLVQRIERYQAWEDHRNDPDTPREDTSTLHPLFQPFKDTNIAIVQANVEWIQKFADAIERPDLAEKMFRAAVPHMFADRDRMVELFDKARDATESIPTLRERVENRWADFVTADTPLLNAMWEIAERTPAWTSGLTPMHVEAKDYQAYRPLVEQRAALHARIAQRLDVLIEAAGQ